MMDTYDRGDVRESYEAAAASIDSGGHDGHRLYVRHKSQETTSERVNKDLINVYSRFPECKRWIGEGFDDIYNYKSEDKEAKDLVRKNKSKGIDTKIWPIALTPSGETRGEGYVAVFEKRK